MQYAQPLVQAALCTSVAQAINLACRTFGLVRAGVKCERQCCRIEERICKLCAWCMRVCRAAGSGQLTAIADWDLLEVAVCVWGGGVELGWAGPCTAAVAV